MNFNWNLENWRRKKVIHSVPSAAIFTADIFVWNEGGGINILLLDVSSAAPDDASSGARQISGKNFLISLPAAGGSSRLVTKFSSTI